MMALFALMFGCGLAWLLRQMAREARWDLLGVGFVTVPIAIFGMLVDWPWLVALQLPLIVAAALSPTPGRTRSGP